MHSEMMNTLTDKLITKSLELGATVAGLVSIGDLFSYPAHDGFPITQEADMEDSVLVLGLNHPPSMPELDWFIGRGGTEGNRILMRINAGLVGWLLENFGIQSRDLPYYAEKGGVLLKDSAVLAGLGIVGINNLLVSPTYGPHLRFRALLISASLTASARPDYSPCKGCGRPCLEVCPEGALTAEFFDSDACLRRMARDGAGDLVMDVSAVEVKDQFGFCRLCELACPLSGSRQRFK